MVERNPAKAATASSIGAVSTIGENLQIEKMVVLDGAVCWVSGAAQGIGLGLCEKLVASGASVLVVDKCDSSRGTSVAKELSQKGPGKAAFFHANLTKVDELRRALEQPQIEFGAPASVVIGNAGMVCKDDDLSAAQTMFELNTTSVILGTQIATELMVASGIKSGVVINTASLAGLTPVTSTPMYAGSKWAVVGHTLSCGELYRATGVRVNCICPALVKTPAVGSFFQDEFSKPDSGKALKAMLNAMMDPSQVVDAFMHILDDDSMVAKAVVVHPAKTFVHNPRFDMTLGQLMDPKTAKL